MNPTLHAAPYRTIAGGQAFVNERGESYLDNSTVRVTAVPAEGWRFLQWQSGTEVMSLSPDYRFAITESTALTAVFEEDPAVHPLRVQMDGPKAVTAVFKPYVDISVDINDDGVYLAEDGLQ